jgi:hypothetical protein
MGEKERRFVYEEIIAGLINDAEVECWSNGVME